VSTGAFTLHLQDGDWRLAFDAFVHDRPGELAEICSFMAERNARITRFDFNRSEDPHMVEMEVALPSAEAAGPLARDAAKVQRLFSDKLADKNQDVKGFTEPEGLLRLKVQLKDSPNAMGALAELCRSHHANIIHMVYREEENPNLLAISVAADSPEQAAALLRDMNERDLAYHVEWTGKQGGDMGRILGLNEVESFMVRLKTILPPDKHDAAEDLLNSTSDLRRILSEFRRQAGETGESLAASEVFTKALQLAAASATKTGSRFALTCTGPLRITQRLRLSRLACPTGANGYLITDGNSHLLIDSSYGLFYADAMQSLVSQGVDPSRIELMLLTHADADHAGWAAPLQRDYGVRIMRHPHTQAVFESENRAEGAHTRLCALNRAYTRLVNRFSDLQVPERMEDFPPHPQGGELGGFPVIGLVRFQDLELTVLESLGGHAPGNVFFLDARRGLLFSGDYLIDVASLADRDKETLSLPRYLMTSTNADSRVFSKEMDMLKALMRGLAKHRAEQAIPRVFPGHGAFYAVGEANW
jgi:glyoxylase-like metal-dependent hydrolase (beta-lactamase superfamily II)/glycine cleavage system regulatory protein